MRVIICDVCGTEERSKTHDYLGAEFTWIVVEANEDADHAQLCSWSCLATWALAKATEREGYVLQMGPIESTPSAPEPSP